MARSFNGSDEAIEFSDLPSMTTFTVFAWTYQDESGTNNTLLAGDNYPSTPREEFLYKAKTTSNRVLVEAI